MARRRITPDRIQRALAKHEGSIRRAFEQAIRERRESINLRALVEAIENRDIGRAVEIAGISRGDMFPLDQAMRTAYLEGAQTIPAAAPAFAARIALDGNAPRATEWARNHVGGLITEIIETNRTAIRGIITQQLVEGQGPRQAAIAVRGQIGLTTQQTGFVANAKAQLSNLDAGYFTRQLRDRRFDGIVRRAIADGKPLASADIDRITQRYSERLLKHRSEVIARTESITALRAGRREGIQQGIEQGAIASDAIKRGWSTSADERVREDHVDMNGEEVDGMDTPWELPDGSLMMFPGDTSLGADASQTINCFAPWTKIARAGLTAAMRHDYAGDLVELSLGGVVNLAVTPNHPIMTLRGWVRAGEVQEGDGLFHCSFAHGGIGTSPDVEAMQATAEELYNAAQVAGSVMGTRGVVVDFHGYVPDKQVDIVSVPRSLGDAIKSVTFKECLQRLFAFPDVAHGSLLAERMLLASYGVFSDQSYRLVSFGSAGFALFRRGEIGCSFIPVRDRGAFYTKVAKATVNCATTATNFFSNAKDWVASLVKSLDLWQQGGAAFSGNIARAAAPKFHGSAEIHDAQILKAGTGSGLANSKLVSNGQYCAKARPSRLDGGQERAASNGPMITLARVDAIRRFHYDGHVYNFESGTNVLVADGIVSHNCRCFENYVVDWLRG